MSEVNQAGHGSVATTTPRGAARARGRGLNETPFALLLVTPGLALFAAFTLYPLANSVYTAFFEQSLIFPGSAWRGISNFTDVLAGEFWPALLNTLIFSIGATLLSFVIGLTLALILDNNIRGRSLMRGLLLLPWVLPGVVVSFLWSWIFNGNFGVLNSLLEALHLSNGDTAWLAKPDTAMAAVIIAKSWMSFPWIMVMLLAALQGVSQDLVEAAAIDGAGKWRIIQSVKLPHLRSIIYIVLLLETSYNFQHFDTLFVMTGGGPGKATSTLAIEVYNQAFNAFDIGHAAALGTLWLLVLAIPTAAYLWLAGREESAR